MGIHQHRSALRRGAIAGIVIVTLAALVGPLTAATAASPRKRVISVGDATVTEGNSGTVNATFAVSLDQSAPRAITVYYTTANGTAQGSVDYTATTGSVSFAPGEQNKVVTVAVLGDALHESNETFFLNITRVWRAKAADGQGLATILNDDAPPTLSIGDATVSEADSAVVAAFPVTMSAPSGTTVTAQWATAASGGTNEATAGSDYTAVAPTTVTFAPGQTSATVSVSVLTDSAVEPAETFAVNLSNAVNATIADGAALGTILDNDPAAAVTVSVGDVAAVEGNSIVFDIVRSASAPTATSVTYATADVTARAGFDYTAVSGTATIPANQTVVSVAVPTAGDALAEPSETFFLNLLSATSATFTDSQAVGTILDNDAAPSVSIADVSVGEGDSGISSATLDLTLSAPSGQAVTVTYSTSSATHTATANADYGPANGETVTFSPGETQKSVTISIAGDTINEPNETFAVNLTGAEAATIADGQAVVTIIDDDEDPSPDVSISDATVTEGDSGSVVATFLVTLSDFTDEDVTVDFTTVAGTSTAGSDYTATSGTIRIDAGDTSQVVSVNVLGDTEVESTETFTVALSNVANADLADTAGLGTILDNDTSQPPRTLSISDASIVEGDAGTSTMSFVVTAAGTLNETITVTAQTAPGSAVAPDDYTSLSVVLSFAPGETTRSVLVNIVGDANDEGNENLLVNLVSPSSNARIVDGQGEGTIIDNDDPPATPALPELSVGDVRIGEGDTGTTSATFTVSLSQAASSTVTASWSTAPGTALAPADFTAAAGTVTFPAGASTALVTVAVAGDALDELDETFFVNVLGATGATVVDGQGVGTIVDNDPQAVRTLAIADASVAEGGVLSFVVTMGGGVAVSDVTVSYATAFPTAGASSAGASDITAAGGTLTIPAGSTFGTIAVSSVEDTIDESDETFFVNLIDASAGVSITDPQAVGTIVDDDTTSGGDGGGDGGAGGGGGGGGGAGGGNGGDTVSDATGGKFTLVAKGYRLVATDGGIFTFGDAPFLGSTGNIRLNQPIVGMAPTPSGNGYWMVARDGGIFTFGDAAFLGSAGNIRLNQPIVGMAATPTGKGYWMVATDGGIFAFGDASFLGSTGNIRLNQPIVGMAPTPSGKGYWMVARDGGIFTFGDAAFFGSAGNIRLNQPIVGMAATPTGKGYRFVATDGGIFTFGDASFLGSTGNIRLNQPIVGMAATPSGNGYWMTASDGGMFTFGDAPFLGSTGNLRLNQPIVGMAPVIRSVPAV